MGIVMSKASSSPPDNSKGQSNPSKDNINILFSFHSESSKDNINILFSFHSESYKKVEDLQKFLEAKGGYNVVLVSETSPCALDTREHCVKWADIVFIISTFGYQRSPYCVELANYVKDCKKPVVSTIFQRNYMPTGAVGAICLAWGKLIEYTECMEDLQKQLMDAIKEKLTDTEHSKVGMPVFTFNAESDADCQTISSGSYVCITFAEDGRDVATMLQAGQGVSNQGASANSLSTLPIKVGRPNQSNGDLVKNCKVFIPVLTTSFQESAQCKEDYECARKHDKSIIPVKGEKFRPAGWLSLAIAGKLYYEMINSNQAYARHKHVPDSTPMNDFIYAVITAWEGKQTQQERERAQISALQTQIEDIKLKLDTWPPKERLNNSQRSKMPTPTELVTSDTTKLPLKHITYTVTRMSFTPPKPLFDKHGIDIPQRFDVMLSYQWDIQDFVRSFYMDFSTKTFSTWMDVWGGMQGNINEAMAIAVENSTVVLSFLTDKYQKSVNCNLELMYARQLRKPIVFVLAERNLQLKSWIQDLVKNSVSVEMSSAGDFGVMDNGVPKINRLAEAVRNILKWSAVQPNELRTDVSEEVYMLQNQLEDALCAQAEQDNRKRFERCTRCGAQFELDSPVGCKIHGAYFMGGTIIAGRWVCCSQRDKNSMGCENAHHTTRPRKWKEMSHKGCFQWNPK